MEYFIKYKKEIFRIVGGAFLLIGFVIHFWVTPQKAVSKSELAAANVARMEASVQGSSQKKVKKKADPSHIAKALKATRAKQMEYLTIFAMLAGGVLILFSFFKKDE
ncbi:MAG: hypothetical protein ABGW85_09775 [Sulfurimonas sp.]